MMWENCLASAGSQSQRKLRHQNTTAENDAPVIHKFRIVERDLSA